MMRFHHMTKLLPCVATALVFSLFTPVLAGAAAGETQIVRDSSGKAVFQLNYIGPGQRAFFPFMPDDPNLSTTQTTWDITAPHHSALRDSIANGLEYWADILGPRSRNQAPSQIRIGGISEDNAESASPTYSWKGDSSYTILGFDLAQGVNFYDKMREFSGEFDPAITYPDSSLAPIVMGDWPSYGGFDFYYNGPVTALPKNGDSGHTAVTALHELGHALGIGFNRIEPTPGKYQMMNSLNLYTQHIVNAQGAAPRPGQTISLDPRDAGKAGVFFVDEEGPLFFEGSNLRSVLGDAYPQGAPINPWEWTGTTDVPEFSHIEFPRSLMSHQNYRNTGVFYEAELAIMQDMGFDLDRKNHFGFSVYDDGLTIDNAQGFSARNASGTAYLPGVHNPTKNAIGLHVFGSGNQVTQKGDILSSGFGSLGVRVDGIENDILIAPGTRIDMTGAEAVGVAVAYGRNHTLTHSGTIVASGENSRGVSFDFGSNIMGDCIEYRGSYIWADAQYSSASQSYVFRPLRMDPDDEDNDSFYGALVDRFDVSGAIAAKDAIYIAPNALVSEINILSGASIQGDIRSEWNPLQELGKHHVQAPAGADFEDMITSLSFGKNAAGGADASFAMQYRGDIIGGDSVAMTVAGGALRYDGNARVVSLHNRRGATLSGNGTVTIADVSGNFPGRATYANDFVNDGVLFPGEGYADGTMTVVLEQGADFENNGVIRIGFNQSGDHDVLRITGTSANNALRNGETDLYAAPGYYMNGQTVELNPDELVQVDGGVNEVGEDRFTASAFTPTLEFAVRRTAGGGVAVTALRSREAYAQFGDDDASRTVGYELQRISYLSGMPEGFHDILAGLDYAGGFEGQSGVERALHELLPHFANSAAARSLDNQRVMTSALMDRLFPEFSLPSCGDEEPANGPRMFATALGGGGRQSGRGYGNPGYSYWSGGVATGLEWGGNGRTVGAHLAMTHTKQRGSGTADRFRSDAVSFGLHGRVSPADWGGAYLFGLARGTVERNRLEREVDLLTSRSVNDSKWTGFSGTALLGGGVDFECGTVRFGPYAGLDYAATHRKSVEEGGRFGRLALASETYQSFRVIAGLRVSGQVGEKTSLSASAQWNHELLDKTGTTRAKFADVGLNEFSVRGRFAGRDSLGVRVGLKYAINDCMDFSVEAGGEFLRRGYASGWGSASLGWEF